jgi:hypothetical protein
MGEISLSHGVEGVTQEDGVRCLVRLEMSIYGRPEIMGSLIGLHGEVKDGVVNGAIQPATDTEVGLDSGVVARVSLICARRLNFLHTTRRRTSTGFSWKNEAPGSWAHKIGR